ncbi:retrovirus-related pol polyprotein from transposon TNT 1-94 [Tanacetum coccineum]
MTAVEVPHTLEYRGGQLNAAPILEVKILTTNWKKRFMCHIIGIEPQFENIIKNGPFIPMVAGQRKPEGHGTGDERKAANLDQRLKSLIMSVLLDDQMNFVINCLTTKSTWDDMILYHKGPSDVKESRVMDLKLCYNTFKFKEGETLTQTFTKYKALMNELVNDGIKLSKLKIYTSFINGLTKKCLSFCQSLRNTNHVKDSELASLFGKLKYEENLIDSIYETKKRKSLVSTTPLLTAFISSSIVQDFQDCPDDEEDTRSSHDSPQQKPELRPTKDFEAKYNKVKAKLALQSSSASASKAAIVKNKGLIAKAYELDEEEVSSYDNEMVEVKVLMELVEENDAIIKEGARNGEWVKISMRKKRILGADQLIEDPSSSRQKNLVFVKSSADNTKVSIPGVEIPWLFEAEGFILPNHDTGRILPAESQRNITDPSIAVTDSSAIDYDSTDESLVCSTPLPPLKKLDGVKPISGPKTIKSILRSKYTFKTKTLKGVIINEPSSAPTKDNKSSSSSKLTQLLLCDIRKPIWYLDSGCSRHMTGVKSYLHKCMEQPRPKVVFGDDSTCIIEGYCSIKCNGIFDEKRGTIFNSNKEVVMIAPRDKPCSSCEKVKHHRSSFKTKQTSSIKKCLHLLHMDLFKPVTPRSINHEKYTLVIIDEYSRNSILVNFCDEKGISQNFSSPCTPEQNGVAERKNKTLIEAARTMFLGSVFSKQYWTEAENLIKKADDGYLLGYSLVSKAFRVFNTRRQQTEETYHITFDESPDAIKFSKPLYDNINIVELERYPPDEYLYPYEPSQRYQTNSNDVSFIEPYESLEPVVLESEVSLDQNGQVDQNEQTTQTDDILHDNLS